MARYIDATKLEELCDIMADKCDGIGESIWHQFRTTVEWCPTADVVERKMGKWTLNREGNWACPFCKFDPYHDNMKGMNYCPNCGARLEGYDGEVH